MYAVLQSPISHLTTVVSMNSQTYIDLKFAGYETIKEGSKRNMEKLYEQSMEDFCEQLEYNNQD